MPASSQVTESISIIKMMLNAGSNAGVDPAVAANAIHLNPELLGDANARVPMDMEIALWDFLVSRTGDEFFGLHAGEGLTPGEFDVMDYAIRTSQTLRQALENASRYNRLLHDEAIIELVVGEKTAVLKHYFRTDPQGANWQAADFTLASIVGVGRAITGKNWKVNKVCFQHAEPKDVTVYKQYFSAKLEFLCDCNSIEFNKAFLDTPIPKSDPALNLVLTRHADELLKNLPISSDIVERVREKLAKSLRGGNPGIDAIAESLNMTSRTLQRKLKESDTSHKELLDDMRKNLAKHYLENKNIGVSEVAYLLGYSEPSVFHRAFKRWFDLTPTELMRCGKGVTDKLLT